jgi:hypothetical protein
MVAKRFWGPIFQIFEIFENFGNLGFFKFVTSYAASFQKL